MFGGRPGAVAQAAGRPPGFLRTEPTGLSALRDTAQAMSQRNVEIVRRFYDEGLIDRDPEAIVESATPDVEYVNPPYAVEPGVRRGPVAVARAMRGFSEVWEEAQQE